MTGTAAIAPSTRYHRRMQPRRDLAPLLRSALVILAPMAGVTDAPFRAICKRMGAGLTYTEMVSAKGLHYNPGAAAARALLSFAPEEVPVAIQLFGADPQMMAEQAARLYERYAGRIAFLDVNMGCPVAKVVRKGEGCALMRDPERAATVVRAIAERVDAPVTAKFRAGWSADEVNAVEFALALEEAGACALAVHGRTREQFYSGRADWCVIVAVKSAVRVPVIGSGDVFSADDAKRMLEQTGVDAVMIARGAQGNPWIFAQARALIERGERLPKPSWLERIDVAREHAEALVAFAGERAFTRMRKHVAWYVHEMPGAARFRELVNHARSHAELVALLDEYRAWIAEKS
ncbi:tRNA-dihydrouridine synthase [Coriobacteriaceae bacterium EMTCatB1]|nr:tRNA-dihydrouridine synthase [Coriobacteriaceae bacterium EMTCatB1]